MADITVDNKVYDIEKMSAEARQHLGNLQFVEAEMVRHKNQLAVLQTAHAAYAHALKEALEKNAKHDA